MSIPLEEFLAKFQKKIPLELACDWDNVGLLIEPYEKFSIKSIMLTNDLTETVLNEAINKNVNLIISYHPPIFRPFKSIRQNNWKEKIISKCLIEKIAVYSPHTALDAIVGGINDWLLEPFNCCEIKPIEKSFTKSPFEYSITLDVKQKTIIDELKSQNLQIQINKQSDSIYSIGCNSNSLPLILDILNNKEKSIVHLLSITNCPKVPLLNEGIGRIGQLANPTPINQIITTLKNSLGLNKLRLALSKDHSENTLINSIGVCAGSGGSLLRQAKADFFITGEMSHHEILDIVSNGTSVALCEHSNTERGYLKTSLYQYLIKHFNNVPILISESDQDPIRIV